jgi:hypothetical protein
MERAEVCEEFAKAERAVAETLRRIGDGPGADDCERRAKANDASAAMCREWARENISMMTGGVR